MSQELSRKVAPVFSIQEMNAVWREVLHLGTKQSVPKGYVWGFDGIQRSFSFLHKGAIRLSYTSRHGQERIALHMDSGCIFREMGTFYTVDYHPSTIKSVEACEVYHFPSGLVRDPGFMRQYPALLSNMVESLAVKAGAFYTQLVEGSDRSPENSVCRYLALLAQKHKSTTFAPGISQEQMAQALGLHRSTVCRILRELRERGAIGVFTRRRLEIWDVDLLWELGT